MQKNKPLVQQRYIDSSQLYVLSFLDFEIETCLVFYSLRSTLLIPSFCHYHIHLLKFSTSKGEDVEFLSPSNTLIACQWTQQVNKISTEGGH